MPFWRRAPVEIVPAAIRALGGVAELEAVSSLYASPAWPDPADPPFVNAAAAIRTDLPPEALLSALHTIEAAFGRRRSVKNAPRTLDLDLLAYGDRVIGAAGGPGLILPHPAIAVRDFVLAPLCEIAPDWGHPQTGLTPGEMLAARAERTATRLEGRGA